MLNRLHTIFNETCKQMDAELIEYGGEEDHIHLMVSCHPKRAISSLVGKLKGKSSYYLRKEFRPQLKKKLWGNKLWSPSYCVVSCGGGALETVRKYVAEQRKEPLERHVKQSKTLIKTYAKQKCVKV